MRFAKMQGLGNDYVYLDCMSGTPDDLPRLAVKLSDRHFGVGGDGLICVCPSEKADFRMRIFNADGSEGEMCGNGIRCVGKFVYDRGLTDRETVTVETLAGVKTLWLSVEDGRVRAAKVDMGRPGIGTPRELRVKGRGYEVTPVSMGNPHIVLFVNDVKEINLTDIGPCFEHHPAFPGRVNTEFVRVMSPRELEMRVWERGSGETLACGTGACAALVAAAAAGKTLREAVVHLRGGDLRIEWQREQDGGRVYMTGPAVTVFEGDWPEDRGGK